MSDLVTKSFPFPFEISPLFVLCVTRQNQIKFQIDIIQTVQYLKKHGRISVKLPPLVPDNNGAFVILTRIGLFIKHSQVQAGRNDDALFPYLIHSVIVFIIEKSVQKFWQGRSEERRVGKAGADG